MVLQNPTASSGRKPLMEQLRLTLRKSSSRSRRRTPRMHCFLGDPGTLCVLCDRLEASGAHIPVGERFMVATGTYPFPVAAYV